MLMFMGHSIKFKKSHNLEYVSRVYLLEKMGIKKKNAKDMMGILNDYNDFLLNYIDYLTGIDKKIDMENGYVIKKTPQKNKLVIVKKKH